MGEDRGWRRLALPCLILLAAAVLRLWSLPSPPSLYWDEQYYVFDAEVYLHGGFGQPVGNPPPVKIDDEGTWIHPPMGKWIIALLGVGPLGLHAFGWRLPSALFGIAGVALLYLLALRLWGSPGWAAFAAVLLAFDGLHIVQSRLAMLDIFLSTFIIAGFLFLVLDRQRLGRAAATRWPRTTRVFGSPWRLWAGVAFGAAVATKWSGFYALALAVLLCAVWSLRRDGPRDRSRAREAATIGLSLAVVPLLVYLLSYGAFFSQHGFAVHDFVTLQIRMLQYQEHHLKVQPENSRPWTWPLLLHPIQYFAETRGTSVSKIVALGNPVLWWGFLLSLPVAAFTALRRPRWQEAVAFGGYAAMFLPWLLVPRSQFIFYMLPAVPFMCLCLAATLRRLPGRWSRGVGMTFAAATIVVGLAYAPVWTGVWIPRTWADGLRLLPRWPL
ncbi:MAG TPA: phospholipid carrier-dependent glycosyltransferase [Actinomycetota bacterium]|nr:phospholipid carrier-dependent glycosyltransferase [Actinomycetota bacterium]